VPGGGRSGSSTRHAARRPRQAGGKLPCSLQAAFRQPIRCTAWFRTFSHNVTSNAIEIPAATPPKLYCCYRQFLESTTNEIVNKNYDSGLRNRQLDPKGARRGPGRTHSGPREDPPGARGDR
jgi:hypothetical protein